MVARAARHRDKPSGLFARLREALLARRRAREDAEDLALVREALAEGGEPIPWEQVKAENDKVLTLCPDATLRSMISVHADPDELRELLYRRPKALGALIEAANLLKEPAWQHLRPSVKVLHDPDGGTEQLYLVLAAEAPLNDTVLELVDFKSSWYERCADARNAGIAVAADAK